MKSRLLATATIAASLLLPATAGAAIAKTNQFEGTLNPNGCAAPNSVSVSGPSRIDGYYAGTNAGGYFFVQVLDSSGNVVSNTGSYNTPRGGTYKFRACFRNDDGIDTAGIQYVGMIATRAR
jgi:hypothetical protein